MRCASSAPRASLAPYRRAWSRNAPAASATSRMWRRQINPISSRVTIRTTFGPLMDAPLKVLLRSRTSNGPALPLNVRTRLRRLLGAPSVSRVRELLDAKSPVGEPAEAVDGVGHRTRYRSRNGQSVDPQ